MLQKSKTQSSYLQGCEVFRAQDGTFEVLTGLKQIVLDYNSLELKEKLPNGQKRINTLIRTENLKTIEEGQWMPLEKVFFDNHEVHTLNELNTLTQNEGLNYSELFKEESGVFYYKYSETPPMAALRKNERKIISDQLSTKTISSLSTQIGALLETVISKQIEVQPNIKVFQIEIPQINELKNIIKNQPQSFQNWALQLQENSIQVSPDFIQENTFIEVKKDSVKTEQLYRMILYKLIQKKPLSEIQYISLENVEGAVKDFEDIKVKKIQKEELNNNEALRSFKKIQELQNLLQQKSRDIIV